MNIIDTAAFWFTLSAGWVGGLFTAALLYIPYRNYRLDRMVQASDLEVQRITSGLHAGRHAAEPDLADAAGALKASQDADAVRIVYPGPGRLPEPAWVAWIEEHGRYTPAKPKEPSDESPKSHRVLFAALFVATVVVWRVGQAWQRLLSFASRAKWIYQMLWAVGVSAIYRTPAPKTVRRVMRPKRRYYLRPS